MAGTGPPNDSMLPGDRAGAEAARRGRAEFVADCADLLAARRLDRGLVLALGGGHARLLLDGDLRADQAYWLRVWAARGLLWVWGAHATAAIRSALRDDAWRVREMAAKVAARQLLGDLLPELVETATDPVARVRAAAARAVRRITAAGA